MIHTLNDITSHNPAAVVVHNGNEVIMHEYRLGSFFQIQNYFDDHDQDDDIRYSPHVNTPKGLLISWYKIKYGRMSLLKNIFYYPRYHFQIWCQCGTVDTDIDIFHP